MLRYTLSSQKSIKAQARAFIVYYSGLAKKLAIFRTKNNIVNALTQYVYPIEDSAESHSECRKVKEDIWNNHKKSKEISKINLWQVPFPLSGSRALTSARDVFSYLQQIPSDICGRPPLPSRADGKPHLRQMGEPLSGR